MAEFIVGAVTALVSVLFGVVFGAAMLSSSRDKKSTPSDSE